MSYWAPPLLVAVTAALVVLPVTPALYELRKRQDAGPLPASRDDGKITNFAKAFQSRLEPFRKELEACRAKGEVARVRADGMELLLVGRDGFDFDTDQMQHIDTVMCSTATFVASRRVIDADVWSLGTLQIGQDTVLRAGLASDDIVLQPHSGVLRWLHGGGSVYLRSGSNSYHRLSADGSIFLEPSCGFQHMHASGIYAVENAVSFRGHGTPNSVAALQQQLSAKGTVQIPEEKQLLAARPRMRVQGDFVLREGESLCANVITTSEFRVEREASFFGSVKSYKNAVIEEGASVHGSIACGATADLGRDSFLAGPLMAEGDVFLASGSSIGKPDAPTTIAACGARLTVGCRIYGAIWARKQGRVES
jgi:predicted acyltransferase (DUF342 family)